MAFDIQIQRRIVMQPRLRIGLIVGVIGLVLNVCLSGLVGICGPFLSLLAGAGAGFFAARQEKLLIKSDGAKAGAAAGCLAGGLIVLGQIIGGVGALYFMRARGMSTLCGQIPSAASGPRCPGFVLSGWSWHSYML
jgi:hypothetical protein